MAHYLRTELYNLIKQDESIFDFIQEGSLDGLWYWDLENPENEWMNARFWQVLGYKPEDMPHKASAWQDIINKEDLKLALDNFYKHVDNPQHPYDQEVRYTHKNGSTVWVRCRGLAIRDEKGKAIRMLGAHQDITNLKIAEAKLKEEHEKVRENEEMYRFLAENAADVIRYQLPSGVFSYISPNIFELTGYTAEEYLKFGPVENVFPEDHKILEQAVDSIIKGKSLIKVEYRVYNKSGDIIWLQSRIKANRDKNGKLLSMLSSTNNITEQKKLQLELSQSEEKYKAMYNNAPLAFQSLDIDGNLIEVNPQWLKILEYNKEDIIGTWFGSLLHPDFVEHFRKSFPKFKNQGFINDVQFRMKKKNGEYIYVSFEGCIGYTPEGKFNQTYCTFKDITVEKEAEIKLKESESRYKQLVETSSDAIYLVDENGTIVDINETATNILGKTRNEIVNKPINTVDPNYPVNDFIAFWEKVPEGKQNIFETTHIKSNGELIPIEISAKKFHFRNKTHYYCVARDITERKTTLEQIRKQRDMFETVINSVPARIFWKDKDSIYMGCNPNFAIDAGVNSVDDVIGKKDDALVWGKDAEQYRADDREIMKTGKAKLNFEEPFIGVDGKMIIWETNKMPLRNNEGEITGVLATSENITDKKLAEEQLKQSEEKFRGVFEDSNVGIAIGSAQGDVIEVNDEYLKITGYTREEFVNLNFAEITHPDDLKKELPLFEKLHNNEIDNYRIQKRLRAKNEAYVWLDCAITGRKDNKGNVDQTLAMVIDITEGKKATETVNVFFEQPMNIHLISTIEGKILKVNKGWEQTLGYSKKESIGKNIFDFINLDDKESTHSELNNLKQGKTTLYFENRYKHKNGNYIILAWSAIFNTSGKLLHCIAKDITQQKEYHEALLKSEENYKALSENAKHIIIKRSLDGKIVYANKFTFDFMDIPKEKLIGSDIKQLFSNTDDAKDLQSRIHKFEKGKPKTQHHELSVTTIRGNKKVLDILSSPIITNDKLDSILITAYDITERKHAEEKILKQNEEYEALNEELRQTNEELSIAIRHKEESNERFNLAIKATFDGLWDWNLLTNDIYYSPRWKSMLGYDDHELPNDFSVWEKLTDDEGIKKAWDMLNQLINRDIDKFDMEFKMQHKNGHWIDIQSRANVFFNNENKAYRVVGTHTDITERKHAENKIRESEERLKLSDSRYRKAEEIGKVGNWEYIIHTDEFWASDESKRIYGFDLKHDSFTSDKVESCIPDRVRVHQSLIDLIEHNKPYKLEFDIIDYNSGKLKTITSIAELVNDNSGKPQKVVGVIQDITERKKAENKLRENEEKLRLAIDNSPLGITLNDMNGNYVSVNKAYEKIVGYSKEELLKMNFFEITHPDFLPKNEKLFKNMSTNKEPGFSIEKKYIHKNGNIIDVRINAGSIKDNTGKALFGMAFTEDITWRKEVENNLIIAKEKAEESNRLKTEFLHNMSHEIRTPMNGIMGFSNLLFNLKGGNDEQKYYSSIIQNSSTQLLRIIDDILDISTLETKQVKIQKSEFDINLFIMELFSIYDLKSKERHIPLYVKKDFQNENSLIISDKTKINKILTNLLDNAFKFTSSGKIEFGYKVEHPNIVFFVKDTGVGIPKDKQARIFERFSQESSQTAQKFGGLGLGLSIAKENAELLNGKLTVESIKGKGSTFFVEIPYNPSVKENNISDSTTKNDKDDIVTILIAEDEEVNYLYLEIILENSDDYKVKLLHVTDGKEAVDRCLNDDSIDLVLMDIKMPIMNGYLATEKIKAVKPDLPIIAQTAYSTTLEKETALKYGCNDFISKPIVKEELISLISKYLRK